MKFNIVASFGKEYVLRSTFIPFLHEHAAISAASMKHIAKFSPKNENVEKYMLKTKRRFQYVETRNIIVHATLKEEPASKTRLTSLDVANFFLQLR